MAREYLLVFAQALDEFRIPEIDSVCEVLNIKISYNHEAINTAASQSVFWTRLPVIRKLIVLLSIDALHASLL